MGLQKIAAFAAALSISTPCLAQELVDPAASVTFYLRIPLGAPLPGTRPALFGLSIQGANPYEAFYLDGRMLGLEATWLLAGGLALGAAVAVHRKDKKQEQQYEEQRQRRQDEPCPQAC